MSSQDKSSQSWVDDIPAIMLAVFTGMLLGAILGNMLTGWLHPHPYVVGATSVTRDYYGLAVIAMKDPWSEYMGETTVQISPELGKDGISPWNNQQTVTVTLTVEFVGHPEWNVTHKFTFHRPPPGDSSFTSDQFDSTHW